MRATAIFFLYLLLCLLLAAALTPPLVASGWLDFEPHRVLSRLAQVFMILGIWPLLRILRLDDRHSLGYGWPRGEFLLAVAGGWLVGAAILAALALGEVALELRVADPQTAARYGEIAARAAQYLASGLLIAVLEETFFRGALFTSIRRRRPAASAIVWSALLYAAVHFLKPDDLAANRAVDWAASGQMVAGAFAGALDWRHLDSFVALFLAGVLLGLVRERTGHIGWCLGLHAGWVFVIQLTRYLTDGNAASPLSFLTGDYDGVIGWLAAGWLAVLSAGYWNATRMGRVGTEGKSEV